MNEYLQAANTSAENVTAPEGIATPRIKLNLQLFAEDDPAPADPAPAPADPAPNPTPEPDVTNTQVFARRLKEETSKAEQRAKDDAISKLSGGQYSTWAEYEQALEQEKQNAEAQQSNIDPQVYQRLVNAENTSKQALERLSKYEQKEAIETQAAEMAKDPKWSGFFNENKDEILSTASQSNCDLQTARLIVLDKKYQTPNMEEIKKNAVKEYIENLKKGNKPVEGSGNAPITVPGTPKTWEEARKGAREMLRASKQ
jgi:hypothetical protein